MTETFIVKLSCDALHSWYCWCWAVDVDTLSEEKYLRRLVYPLRIVAVVSSVCDLLFSLHLGKQSLRNVEGVLSGHAEVSSWLHHSATLRYNRTWLFQKDFWTKRRLKGARLGGQGILGVRCVRQWLYIHVRIMLVFFELPLYYEDDRPVDSFRLFNCLQLLCILPQMSLSKKTLWWSKNLCTN